MIRFFGYLLLLIAVVWLGLLLSSHPGYVYFVFGKWSLTTPIWFFVVITLLFLFIISILLRLSFAIRWARKRFRIWKQVHRTKQANRATARGLVEFAEGHWQRAEQILKQSAKFSDAPVINYLAAAHAAQEQDLLRLRDEYLQQAYKSSPTAEVAVTLTQAQLQKRRGQLEQAVATLQHLHQTVPQHSYVLKLLLQLYIKLQDWQKIAELLPKIIKQNIVPAEEIHQLQNNVAIQELLKAENISELQKKWHALKRKQRQQKDLIKVYVDCLLSFDAFEQAEKIIKQALNKQWHNDFLTLYVFEHQDSMAKRIQTAEKWLHKQNHNPALLACLGQLWLQSQSWTKARDYYAKACQLEANPNYFYQYGKILEALGDHTQAMQVYRRCCEERINLTSE